MDLLRCSRPPELSYIALGTCGAQSIFFLCHVLCKDSIPFQAAFKYLTMYHPGIYEVQWEHNGKKCRHRRFGHEINLLTMSVKWLRVVLMTKNYGIFRGGFLVLPYNKKICRLWFCGIKQHCK